MAGPVTSEVATIPVHAVAGRAVAVTRALRTVAPEAATRLRAGLAGPTLSIRLARLGAELGIGIARKRRTFGVHVLGTRTFAIACCGVHDAIALAGSALAGSSFGMLATCAGAVALSVLSAAGNSVGHAETRLGRLHPRRNEGAGTERARQIAGFATFGACGVATNAANAIAASAFIVARAGGRPPLRSTGCVRRADHGVLSVGVAGTHIARSVCRSIDDNGMKIGLLTAGRQREPREEPYEKTGPENVTPKKLFIRSHFKIIGQGSPSSLPAH